MEGPRGDISLSPEGAASPEQRQDERKREANHALATLISELESTIAPTEEGAAGRKWEDRFRRSKVLSLLRELRSLKQWLQFAGDELTLTSEGDIQQDGSFLQLGFKVPFIIFNNDGEEMRAYINPDISATITKSESLPTVTITAHDVEPRATQTSSALEGMNKEQLVEWILTKPETGAVDEKIETFNNLPLEALTQLLWSKGRWYQKLLSSYLDMMDQVLDASEQNAARMASVKKLRNYDFTDDNTVREGLRYLSAEEREAMQSFSSMRLDEVAEAIRKNAAEIQTEDAQRWELHRWIEYLAFHCFEGRSPMMVKWEIEQLRAQKQGTYAAIAGDIYGTYDTHSFDPGLSVTFGAGEKQKHSDYKLYPAREFRDVEYTSKVQEGRTFEDDKKLIYLIAKKISDELPGIQVDNRFDETGTFHERYREFEIHISEESIQAISKERGIDPQTLQDQIYAIIRSCLVQEKTVSASEQVPHKV